LALSVSSALPIFESLVAVAMPGRLSAAAVSCCVCVGSVVAADGAAGFGYEKYIDQYAGAYSKYIDQYAGGAQVGGSGAQKSDEKAQEEELQAWRSAQEKRIETYVPKDYQNVALQTLQTNFEKQLKLMEHIQAPQETEPETTAATTPAPASKEVSDGSEDASKIAQEEEAAHEKAAQEKAAQEEAAEEKAADEKAAQERAAEEKAAEETAAQEKAAQKKAADEKAAQEKAAEEKAAEEKAAEEKAAEEKAAQEKAAQEKAAEEEATKEKAAQEKMETEAETTAATAPAPVAKEATQESHDASKVLAGAKKTDGSAEKEVKQCSGACATHGSSVGRIAAFVLMGAVGMGTVATFFLSLTTESGTEGESYLKLDP